MTGPLRSFAYPQFRILWAASLISIGAFFLLNMARGWLILDLTDSALAVTGVQAMGMVPMLLVSLVGGAIADRFPRRTIIILAESFNALTLLVLALLVITDAVQVWHVFVLSFFTGCAFAIAMPARSSAVPDVVAREDMASAMAMFTTIFSAGTLIGPAIAGYLLKTVGMGPTFLAPAIALIPAIGLWVIMKMPASAQRPHGQARGSMLSSIRDGITYVRRDAMVLALLMIGLVITLFAMPYQSLQPVFVRDVLGSDEGGLGWLLAGGGAGALIGSLAIASLRGPAQLKSWMVVGAFGLSAFVIVFAFAPNLAVAILIGTAIGFLLQIFMSSNLALVSLTVPDHMRGRVLSVRMIVFGLAPIGMILLGAVSETAGARVAVAGAGILSLALVAVAVLSFGALRRAAPVTPPTGAIAPAK